MSPDAKQLLRSTLTPFALGTAALGIPCLIDSMRAYQNNDWGMLGFMLFFLLFVSVLILILAATMSAWDVRKILRSDAGVFKWKTSLLCRRHPILGFCVLFLRHLLCAVLGFALTLSITAAVDHQKQESRIEHQNQDSNARTPVPPAQPSN